MPKLGILATLCATLVLPQLAAADVVNVATLTQKQKATLALAKDRFANAPELVKVAFCESSFEHTETDGSVKRGDVDPRDTGVMQINTGYHGAAAKKLGLNLWDINDNMSYALHLYKTQGIQPWFPSKDCRNSLVLVGDK